MIVAGAGSQRLGGADKALVDIGGRTLLDRALDATRHARTTIVVGPERPGVDALTWCREEPPDGGPVAAFAAGLVRTTAPTVVLLAVDLPFVAPAVPALLGTLSPAADAVVLVDEAGRANYLASAWWRAAAVRALASFDDLNGMSMRALMRCVQTLDLPDAGGWSADCDTWDTIEAARRRAAKEEQWTNS